MFNSKFWEALGVAGDPQQWFGLHARTQAAWAAVLSAIQDNHLKAGDEQFKIFQQIHNVYEEHVLGSLELLGSNQSDGSSQERQLGLFVLRQFFNCISPRYGLLNPEVVKASCASKGQNLIQGFHHACQDWQASPHAWRIQMTDEKAFQVGKNIAATAGGIVYRNHLCELIQYEPTTNRVHETPILIVPSWINKYYVLDLSPENSLVTWLLAQGFTVFMISWTNPDASYKQIGFQDYLEEGILNSLKVIQRIAQVDACHGVGFCMGGTALAVAAAYLHQMDQKASPVQFSSLSYWAALLDFKEPGDLGMFLSPSILAHVRGEMDRCGFLDGRILADVFNWLRAEDLIWPNVVNRYLLGQDPSVFDVLYWNQDNNHVACALQAFCLEELYVKNSLIEKKIRVNGLCIDLQQIESPSYFLALEQDHLALWKAVYRGHRAYGAPGASKRFVLAGGGHIAGVLNPPQKNKHGYRIIQAIDLDDDLTCLSAQAPYQAGSWWPEWSKWLRDQTPIDHPSKRVARTLGHQDYPVLMPAPGQYVLKKC